MWSSQNGGHIKAEASVCKYENKSDLYIVNTLEEYDISRCYLFLEMLW